MPAISRTLGPFHFEDLEPHRFEDLVRALLYEFRTWLKLESTGRLGSDDSFDIRGWEGAAGAAAPEEDADAPADFLADARLWLVQCKREKRIGPTQLRRYLNDIPIEERSKLDAVMLVAPCDFSKKARDALREWCIEANVSEYHLWGKADLEDALLQPKNDHLLFAFFGISLALRKRSLKTELRANLATKRKLLKILRDDPVNCHEPVLFRDPAKDGYPEAANPKGLYEHEPGNFESGWFFRRLIRCTHEGIWVCWGERLAILDEDNSRWDATEVGDHAIPHWTELRLHGGRFDQQREREQTEARARHFWNNLPLQRRATHVIRAFLPFESILAIDETGDANSELPTIFATFDKAHGAPFSRGFGYVVTTDGTRQADADPKHRTTFFPAEFPDIEEDESTPFYARRD
ncbi:MAG: restriction endonuclease [Alphaproteobacteria bacterium]|nr:restriction endonuclease [Alphaproteobacteria bacterium]